jgi:hypothetical protein
MTDEGADAIDVGHFLMGIKPREIGWGIPANARKWHFFETDGMSLCRQWGFYRGSVYNTRHESEQNCAECKRLRAKRFTDA